MVSRTPALAALVLCGGQSRRMGQEKALLEIDGVPLVRRVARRMAGVADTVLIAPGAAGRLGDLGYPEVADRLSDAGPLGGLVAGLAASPLPLLAVVAVDMPHASPELMALLARTCRRDGLEPRFDAAVPVTAACAQPLHAVYSRSALPALETALMDGRLAMNDALTALRVALVGENEWRVADPSGRFADNANTLNDLALLA